MPRRMQRETDRLAALSRALTTLDPARPKPGFARVEDADGGWIASAAGLAPGQAVRLVFDDGARGAIIDGTERPAGTPAASRPAVRPAPKPRPPAADQGDLF